MEDIVLVGGGGHCRSCIDVIEQEGRFKIVGVVDMADKIGQDIFGHVIIGCDEQLPVFVRQYRNFLITVGQIESPALRLKLYKTIKSLGGNLPVIISPRAYVSVHALVGAGTIVMHNVTVNAAARVGCNCILNTGCLIEHDAVVGNHCHISTHGVVNGTATVGDGSFVGSNATVVNNIKLGENSFVRSTSLARKSQ